MDWKPSVLKDLFKKLTRRGRDVDVVGYRNDFVHFKTRGEGPRLQLGPADVRAYLPEHDEPIGATFYVRTYDPAEEVYTGTVKENLDLLVLLRQIFPPVAEPAFVPFPEPEPEPEEKPPEWNEKRGEPRVLRVLGVMSAQVPGYRCVTHELSPRGVRLATDRPVETGEWLEMRVDLDDAGAPVQLAGRVVWCAPRPGAAGSPSEGGALSGYWVGVRLEALPEAARQRLEGFLARVRAGEQQVFIPGFDGLR